MKNSITLNLIKSKVPCVDGWKALLKLLGKTEADDTVVTIKHLLDIYGVKDAVWVIFQCIDGKEKEKQHMLVDMAEVVLPKYEDKYPGDNRVRDCIQATRDFIEEKINEEKLEEYRKAAWVAYETVWAAAGVARVAYEAALGTNAAWAAALAVRAAGDNLEMQEQLKQVVLKWFGEC